MNFSWTIPAIALSVLSITVVSANPSPVGTNPRKFSCGQSKGSPTTLAKTKRGVVAVIRWTSTHFDQAGFTSEDRCKIVSKRFQTYYTDGRLQFLTTGVMNQMPVVCVAPQQGSSCSDLLFTLKPGQDSNQALQRLLNVRDRARGPIQESTSSDNTLPESTSSQVYIDISQYLETAPIESVKTKFQGSSKQENTTDQVMPKPLVPSLEEQTW